MRIANLFRRKQQHSLTENETTLLKADAGFRLKYSNCIWIIKKIIEYNWGESYVSYDFILDNEIEIAYLCVEEIDNKLLLSFKKDSFLTNLAEGVLEEFKKSEVPPGVILFSDIQYLFDRESVGKSRIENSTEWTDLISWEYIDKTNKHVLTVERFGNSDFFVSVGQNVSISEIELM